MKHARGWVATALAVAFFFLSALPVAAAIQAQVISLTRIPPNMVKVRVAVNRGVFTGATQGNAPFTLVILFTYQSGGQAAGPDQGAVALAETTPVGILDNRTVVAEATFALTSNPDEGTPIETAARITTHDAGTGEAIDLTEPEFASF